MPRKGTPIRCGQKQFVRNRQQGAETILPRRSWDEVWFIRGSHESQAANHR